MRIQSRLLGDRPLAPTSWAAAFGLGLLALCLLAPGWASERVFVGRFEAETVPSDPAAAARFLNQASFGARQDEIAALLNSDYGSWIEQQIALPASLSRPFLEQIAVNENNAGRRMTADFRVQRWVDVAISAPDQLRQRMAWALGQIVVASDQDGSLFDQPIMMAEWNDMLVRNALGNYRDLLAEATRSPVMGRYLSHLRNRKFEITPACRNLRDGTSEQVDCTGNAASANGTQTPVIIAYLPPSGGLVAPDENYAREIMQLFSIGLLERNADFSPILVGGETVATYQQPMISAMARVFTGLSYACSGSRQVAGVTISRNCGSCTGQDCSFNLTALTSQPPDAGINGLDSVVHPDRYEPMICFPRIHDSGRDRSAFRLPGPNASAPPGASLQLDPGESIPGGTPEGFKSLVLGGSELLRLDEIASGQAPASAPNCDLLNLTSAQKTQCLDYCNSEIDAAVELLFQHPNSATMLARQLIQRLVSSNPSAAYIGRVAAVFADNGSGVRGDLAAVARAILLDSEARQPPLASNSSAGKPREPLLKLIQLWRSIGAVSGEQRSDGYRRWTRFTDASCRPLTWPQCAFQQRPLGSPSVFNFYSPDYQPAGALADAGLYAPELQIVNDTSAILAANELFRELCSGYGSSDCSAALASPPPGDGAYFPESALDALPGMDCAAACTAEDDLALINALDDLLFGGTLSGVVALPAQPADASNQGARGVLFRLLRTGLPAGLGEADPQDGRRRSLLYLLHLLAISPDFARQS